MGRWDDDIPLSCEMAKRGIHIIVYVYVWCLLEICCFFNFSLFSSFPPSLSIFLSFYFTWIFDIDGKFMAFQEEKKKWYAKNESHKFFLSRILMVTRFIYECLEEFNSLLINSSLSSENSLLSKVARWENWKGTWIPFFSFLLADASTRLQLDFDLSEIYSNTNVSISYECDLLEANKSWLFNDDDIVMGKWLRKEKT